MTRLSPLVPRPYARLQRHLRHAADRCQRFAAKTHRAYREQIVRRRQLARGMVAEREFEVVGMDAVAVVDDADELAAAFLDIDVDARRPGVKAVFEQLLDDAGGPFDDLAGSDLGDDGNGKLTDARHARDSHPWKRIGVILWAVRELSQACISDYNVAKTRFDLEVRDAGT